MKNNIVYVDFTERKVLSVQNTSFVNKIKNFIKRLFSANKFTNNKNPDYCKRILNKRHFS